MSRRTFRAGLGAGVAALLTLLGTAAQADPVPAQPGTPIPGKTDSQLYAAVGADAFSELSNNLVNVYNSQSPAPTNLLESYDAINPVTGAPGEQITTKPGCSLARPNGANAGISAMELNQVSDPGSGGDGTSFCIDWARSSRAKGTAAGEASLTFYAQSRDAVGYAVIGNAYAPTTPLTTADLKGIFECTITDWSQVGGQAGPIHVYLPPDTSGTLTFFLQAIGSSVTNMHSGCDGLPTTFSGQQNDGSTLHGDPQGILPYAVTKYAAQVNGAPGILDNRGGVHIGFVNTTTAPTTTTSFGGQTYQVLNPNYATGASASFGRLFYNVVRNSAPADLKAVFQAGGFLCQHEDALLIPFGNTPLGTDTSQSHYCGQAS
jgi:ABC-type phosphate transport system substrate-binding protein